MSDQISTYEVNGAWVVAQGYWLPGGYEDEATARYACRYPFEVLQELNDRIYRVDGENRPITRADLKATRASA